MCDFLAEPFRNADKLWYIASIAVLWIGSAAFVFRHTQRALERRSSKVNASFEWGSEWQFSNDQEKFDSKWEFSSPSLFVFLIGGPILAPLAAFVYHIWSARHVYARIRFIIRNAPDLIRAFVYRKRESASDVLEHECNIEVFPRTDTMRVSLKPSNLGRYRVSIDGIKATLSAGGNAHVLSWTQPWHATFHPNNTGVNISLSLDSASLPFKRDLKEWVEQDAQLGTIVSVHGRSGSDYKFRTLPPNYEMRVEYVNARWV